MSLKDFFLDEDMFIAYGSEKCSHDDFDLDTEGKFEIFFYSKFCY